MKWWQIIFLFYYLFLLGLILLVIPWTRYWMLSIFAETDGLAGNLYRSPYVRAIVSGLGAITILAAVEEIAKHLWKKTR
jgi:hypothetical protein